MFHDPKHDPLGRFDGLARTYSAYRPVYPTTAIDRIVERVADRSLPIADIGAGTGILSRQLAERGLRVIGIEPNESMRAEAAESTTALPIEYRDGQAEQTSLPDNSMAAVVVGQAFHWCDPERSLTEFHRILVPGGWATLLWNQFELADAGTREFWELLRQSTPDRDIAARPHHESGAALLGHRLFESGEALTVPNHQDLSQDGLVGRAFSISYAPKECGASRRFNDSLRELFQRHAVGGVFRMVYRTILYHGRRRYE